MKHLMKAGLLGKI